ncbi:MULTISPECIES: hypothetical protein [Paenibacillus]|nr:MULTISPECIES: hypothetical protein [Paenibacillus]
MPGFATGAPATAASLEQLQLTFLVLLDEGRLCDRRDGDGVRLK